MKLNYFILCNTILLDVLLLFNSCKNTNGDEPEQNPIISETGISGLYQSLDEENKYILINDKINVTVEFLTHQLWKEYTHVIDDNSTFWEAHKFQYDGSVGIFMSGIENKKENLVNATAELLDNNTLLVKKNLQNFEYKRVSQVEAKRNFNGRWNYDKYVAPQNSDVRGTHQLNNFHTKIDYLIPAGSVIDFSWYALDKFCTDNPDDENIAFYRWYTYGDGVSTRDFDYTINSDGTIKSTHWNHQKMLWAYLDEHLFLFFCDEEDLEKMNVYEMGEDGFLFFDNNVIWRQEDGGYIILNQLFHDVEYWLKLIAGRTYKGNDKEGNEYTLIFNITRSEPYLDATLKYLGKNMDGKCYIGSEYGEASIYGEEYIYGWANISCDGKSIFLTDKKIE